MLPSDVSCSHSLPFELWSFASCEQQKLSKTSMRQLTVTHLFTCERFSPTSSCTQSSVRWIALPLSSLPSLTFLLLLLLIAPIAPFSLPFLSEKWLVQRCLTDKCPWKQRNCGENQRSFRNMATGNGDFRTVSWSSFSRLFYSISLSCELSLSTCCHRLEHTANSFFCRNKPEFFHFLGRL